jgi:hypothetical protein
VEQLATHVLFTRYGMELLVKHEVQFVRVSEHVKQTLEQETHVLLTKNNVLSRHDKQRDIVIQVLQGVTHKRQVGLADTSGKYPELQFVTQLLLKRYVVE